MGSMLSAQNNQLSLNLEEYGKQEIIEVYKKNIQKLNIRIPKIKVINIETSKQVQKLLQDSVGQILNQESQPSQKLDKIEKFTLRRSAAFRQNGEV